MVELPSLAVTDGAQQRGFCTMTEGRVLLVRSDSRCGNHFVPIALKNV